MQRQCPMVLGARGWPPTTKQPSGNNDEAWVLVMLCWLLVGGFCSDALTLMKLLVVIM